MLSRKASATGPVVTSGKSRGCDQRGEKAGEMRPADRRQQDRELGKIGEHEGQRRAGRNRREQQRGSRGRAKSNENDLHHRQLSRSLSG